MIRHRVTFAMLLATAVCALLPMSATAQEQGAAEEQAAAAQSPRGRYRSSDPARAGAFEILLGGELLLSESLGSTTATMLANNSSSTRYNYFSTSGTRATAPAFRLGVGYAITRMLTVEAGFLASRGNLNGTISDDVENATSVSLAGRMTQYFLDASVLAHLEDMAFASGAGVPYVEAGAGYLRQLQEGNYGAVTGQVYHLGGGVRYLLSQRRNSSVSGLGLRIGARAYIQNKGYTFGSSRKVFGSIDGGLLVIF